jgi:cupin fold WbuC family metalloprotein
MKDCSARLDVLRFRLDAMTSLHAACANIRRHPASKYMKKISLTQLEELAQQAALSPRGRAHLNVHDSTDDLVQRFFVEIEPCSYVRPHRHHTQAELLTVLRGCIDLLILDAAGTVLERHAVGAGSDLIAYETPRNTWHTLISCSPGTVFLEVTQGPYNPMTAVEFAPWAPAEGTPAAAALLERLRTAEAGQSIPK